MNREKQSEQSYKYRYLPALTLLLLAAMAGLALRWHLLRPPGDLRRQLASIQAALELIPEYYPEVDRESLVQAAMEGIIASLGDPRSRYLTPAQLEQADIDAEGEFGGIGVVISPANNKAIIIDLIPEGAAKDAGLLPGDIIIKAAGRRTEDMDFTELISLIRGRPGTAIELAVQSHKTGDVAQVKLERRMLELAPVKWEVLPDRIGILRLQSFSGRSIESLEELLRNADREDTVDGLILDLRDNPGGLLDGAVRAADMFLTEGIIATIEYAGKDAKAEKISASETALISTGIPMAVIVNERSASASEVLAGALKSRGRAAIVGTGTAGKGSINTVFSLPDGSGLLLKVAGYVAGDDIEVESKGIEPDIVVGELPPAPAGADAELIDEWLRKKQDAQSLQEEHAAELLRRKIGRTDGE